MSHSNAKTIAYLEDDPLQRVSVSKWLIAGGYNCTLFDNAEAIKQAFTSHQYDAILLDWQLETGSSGLDVLKHFRSTYSHHVPVLFHSSKSNISDINAALSAGADDFLVKPITQNDLLRKLEDYLQPAIQKSHTNIVDLAPYENDCHREQLWFNGQPLLLSENEYIVITYLFEHRGQTVSNTILQGLINRQRHDTELTRIESFIQKLKKSIKIRASQRWYIETVHGYGYRLVEHENTMCAA